MQIRCTYCQTMFAISRENMLAALEHMEENKLIYHDAHCPKCRRANRVEKRILERAFPDWKNALKTMEKEAAKPVVAPEKPAKLSVSPKAAAALKTAATPAKKTAAKPRRKAAGKPVKKAGINEFHPKPAPKAKGKSSGTKKK
jgi:hypothetical protein